MTDTDLEKIRRRRRDRNRLGLRQWIVVFLTVCTGDQAGVAAHAWIIPVVGALISFLGVPAGLIGNELSIRYGLRTIATLVFLLSALAGGLLGFAAMLPYITVLGLSWYTLFARAICDGEWEDYFCKVSVDSKGYILGATIVHPHAGNLLAELVLAHARSFL